VGGWGNLLSEQEPERWLDGCREASMIMDGDKGRKLGHPRQSFTSETKDVLRRFSGHPITLHVLRRYGIENYFPRHPCEIVIGRDLSAYFPIPVHKPIEDHFCEPKQLWPRWVNRFRSRQPTTFYRKRLNETIAQHLQLADIAGTDLLEIISNVQNTAEAARKY